jgi:hypothetical protein
LASSWKFVVGLISGDRFDRHWLRLGKALEADWLRLGKVLEADWLRLEKVLEADWFRLGIAVERNMGSSFLGPGWDQSYEAR